MYCKYNWYCRLAIAFYLLITAASAQIPCIGPDGLQAKVKSKTTVAEVMKEVELFYKKEAGAYTNFPNAGFDDDYAKWKRWEAIAKTQTGPNGTFYNVPKSLWDVHEKITTNQITPLPNSLNTPTTPEWIFSGPFSSSYPVSPPGGLNGLGRCDRIAFHPTDPATIFVGTPMGGLWKTTNYGSSWTCLTSFLPIAGVSGVVVDWSNPNNILILTGNGDDQNITATTPGIYSSVGVFKSTDGGINWHQTPIPWSETIGPAPYQLKQSQRFPNRVLMGTSTGLYRSTNFGNTWSSIFNSFACFDIDFVPGTDTAWLAFNSTRPIYRSFDAGLNLTSISFGSTPSTPIPMAANRISLAVTNTNLTTNRELVYIFAGPATGAGTFNGLYKTNASGFISLQRNTPNLFDLSNTGNGSYDQSRYDHCIAVKPTNANMILTGGAKIFKSVDGGGTIINGASYDEGQAGFDLTKYVHGDIHDLAYNPLNNYLYAAHDGGVSYSTDDGATWANISTGLTTAMFYDIAGLESNQFAILSGLQDNGNKYRGTNSSDFIHIGAYDGFHAAISPSNPAKGYYSANGFLIKSDNLGTGTYLGIAPTTAVGQWAWKMNTDVLDGEYLYASPQGTDSIFTSNNGGTSWFRKQLGGGQNEIVNCPSNSNRMYILGGTTAVALRRTNDKGANWTTNLLANPGIPPAIAPLAYDAQVSPVNSSIVYTCFAGFEAGNKVYLSADAGANWINISYNLPNLPILCLAIDNNDNVYAGTDYGVFVKLNNTTVWYYFSNKLPRTRVNDLMLNRTNGILYAATYGRGVWRTSVVNTPCSDAFYSISGNVTGERFYEAGVIWSNATLDTMQGTRVNFKATDSIKLNNNFRATEGVTEFRAFTGPCGSGYPVLSKVKDTTTIDITKLALPSNEKEGDYPYGTIRINSYLSSPNIELNAKKDGNYKIILSTPDGKILKTIYQLPNIKTSKQELPFTFQGLPKGLYYVHLLYNDMLVHFQELLL